MKLSFSGRGDDETEEKAAGCTLGHSGLHDHVGALIGGLDGGDAGVGPGRKVGRLLDGIGDAGEVLGHPEGENEVAVPVGGGGQSAGGVGLVGSGPEEVFEEIGQAVVVGIGGRADDGGVRHAGKISADPEVEGGQGCGAVACAWASA